MKITYKDRNDLTCFGHWYSIDIHQQPGTKQHHIRLLDFWQNDLTGHVLVATPAVCHTEPGSESTKYCHTNAVSGTLHPRITQPHHLKQTQAHS